MAAILVGALMRGADNSGDPVPSSKRNVSEKVAHEVEAKLPKYNPPANTKSESPALPADSSESPDVLRLPTVTVTADTPLPPDWAMVPPEERLKRAINANPGIQVGNFFGLNNAYALTIQREERDLQKKAALIDAVQRTRSDDGLESRRIDQLLKSALVRPSTGWTKGANEAEPDIVDRKKSSRRK